MYPCARICVEVDLEKGFPEAVQLSLDGWYFFDSIDHDKIPLKWHFCHELDHFVRKFPREEGMDCS